MIVTWHGRALPFVRCYSAGWDIIWVCTEEAGGRDLDKPGFDLLLGAKA